MGERWDPRFTGTNEERDLEGSIASIIEDEGFFKCRRVFNYGSIRESPYTAILIERANTSRSSSLRSNRNSSASHFNVICSFKLSVALKNPRPVRNTRKASEFWYSCCRDSNYMWIIRRIFQFSSLNLSQFFSFSIKNFNFNWINLIWYFEFQLKNWKIKLEFLVLIIKFQFKLGF